jgi:hypothetical protein
MRVVLISVAFMAMTMAAAACGPRVDPDGPMDDDSRVGPSPRGRRPGGGVAGRAGRDVLIGEMCPTAAAGRPAVLPMFVRGVGWRVDAADVSAPLERRSARQFGVLGWDGRRVGLFSVAGASHVDDATVAIGGYAGGSPCEKARKPGDAVELESACVASQSHCAVAFAVLEPSGGFEAAPPDEDPDPAPLDVGGACMAGDLLLVDVDGDGQTEAFPASAFLDEARGPADDVTAVAADGKKCTPAFAARGVVAQGDPRDWRGLDLLGVADFDGDGRRELVLVYQYAGRRTWALYSAVEGSAQLDLVGEAVPWSVR